MKISILNLQVQLGDCLPPDHLARFVVGTSRGGQFLASDEAGAGRRQLGILPTPCSTSG